MDGRRIVWLKRTLFGPLEMTLTHHRVVTHGFAMIVLQTGEFAASLDEDFLGQLKCTLSIPNSYLSSLTSLGKPQNTAVRIGLCIICWWLKLSSRLQTVDRYVHVPKVAAGAVSTRWLAGKAMVMVCKLRGFAGRSPCLAL